MQNMPNLTNWMNLSLNNFITKGYPPFRLLEWSWLIYSDIASNVLMNYIACHLICIQKQFNNFKLKSVWVLTMSQAFC